MKYIAVILSIIIAIAFAKESSKIFENKFLEKSLKWTKTKRVGKDEPLQILVAVKDLNWDVMENTLNAVSDPDSPFYGKYLTKKQVDDITINNAGIEKVNKWLSKKNFKDHQIVRMGNFIRVKGKASEIESLIKAEYYHFVHSKHGKIIQRTASYEVPPCIGKVIDFIDYTIDFPLEKHSPFKIKKIDASGSTNPALLFSTYNIHNNMMSSQKASDSVFEGLGQSFDPSDLSQFNNMNNLPDSKVTEVRGPNSPSSCTFNPNSCAEASLDVQYMLAVGQMANFTFWSESNTDPQPFLDWIIALSQNPAPPLVNSMSYGSIEDFRSTPPMIRFNKEAGKLGTRGVTVVISSGDDGVANFIARNDKSECGFHPSFPASCPFVTAVGATMGPETGSARVAETSDNGGLITSGGGFSTVFQRPSYQSSVVSTYLRSSTIPPRSMFSPSGRGYPDVSALGHNYIVVIGGNTFQVSGTSASAPVIAGMLALVNDDRLRAGKPPVGFANPALYKIQANNPSVYHDITSGENNCCAGQFFQVCCQYGFTAIRGWDAVTGLGSINFGSLRKAFMNM